MPGSEKLGVPVRGQLQAASEPARADRPEGRTLFPFPFRCSEKTHDRRQAFRPAVAALPRSVA